MPDLPAIADQAATLRRLFAPAAPRLLPVLMPEQHCSARSAWMARLAQGFARQGERTLVVDAVRAQLAATLGLRARWDLLHVCNGECGLGAALLDAGHGLAVLPAARALAADDGRGSLASELASRLLPLQPVQRSAQLQSHLPMPLTARQTALQSLDGAAHDGFDLVLWLLPASAMVRMPAGEVLVPVLPESTALAHTQADLEHALRAAAQRGDIGGFRLLFLGMEPGSATTLAHRMAARAGRACGAQAAAAVQAAGAVRIARDLLPVVRAAGSWPLAALAPERR